MIYQFENRYTMTAEMLQEYIRRVAARDLMKKGLLLFGGCTAGCAGAFFLELYGLSAIFGAFSFLCLAAGAAAPISAARRGSSGTHVPKEETIVRFTDRIWVQDHGEQLWFDYSEITAVRVYNTFSLFQIGKKDAVILSNSGFSPQIHALFWQFFQGQRPDLTINIKTTPRQKKRRAT